MARVKSCYICYLYFILRGCKLCQNTQREVKLHLILAMRELLWKPKVKTHFLYTFENSWRTKLKVNSTLKQNIQGMEARKGSRGQGHVWKAWTKWHNQELKHATCRSFKSNWVRKPRGGAQLRKLIWRYLKLQQETLGFKLYKCKKNVSTTSVFGWISPPEWLTARASRKRPADWQMASSTEDWS